MARPKKETVDYFPHVVNHGKTLYIIEQKYGNDGYAFWFKLLEMLGNTPGHYLDLNDEATWEFLQAKTHLESSFCNEILDLLAKLEAIDPELWGKRVVWSQNFVNGISQVYTNRRVKTPTKPSFYIEKSAGEVVSTDENPQTKLKETKLNNTKVNNIPLEDVVTIIQQEINPNLNSFELEMIQVWFEEWDYKEIILEAIKETALNKATTLKYTDSILRNWKQLNIKTIEDIERIKQNYQKKKGNVKVESEPSWLEEHQEYRKKTTSNQNNEEVDEEELKKLLQSFGDNI